MSISPCTHLSPFDPSPYTKCDPVYDQKPKYLVGIKAAETDTDGSGYRGDWLLGSVENEDSLRQLVKEDPC